MHQAQATERTTSDERRSPSELPAPDLREQLVRIRRSQAEAETLRIETRRLNAEANKLAAEEQKSLRDRSVSSCQIIIAATVEVAAFMSDDLQPLPDLPGRAVMVAARPGRDDRAAIRHRPSIGDGAEKHTAQWRPGWSI